MKNIDLITEALFEYWKSNLHHNMNNRINEDGEMVIPKKIVDHQRELFEKSFDELDESELARFGDGVHRYLAQVPVIRDALQEDGEVTHNVHGIENKNDRKLILGVDFDGVCSVYGQWHGIDNIPDTHTPYLFESFYVYYEFFHICIFSSRSHQRGGRQGMKDWFEREHKAWFDTLTQESKHYLKDCATRFNKGEVRNAINPDRFVDYLRFPVEKPKAHVSIDDRCITFKGEFPEVQELLNFTPWNRRFNMRAMLKSGGLEYKSEDKGHRGTPFELGESGQSSVTGDEPANVEQEWDKENIGCPEEVADQLDPIVGIGSISYYLLSVEEGIQHIYMHAVIEPPPPMNNHDLENWLSEQFQTMMLPIGDEDLVVKMRPENYRSPIYDWDKSQILDTYALKGNPPYTLTDYPDWLKNPEPIRKIDRFIVIGDPTEYGHLVPITEEFCLA